MKVTFIRHGFADHNLGFLNEGECAYSSMNYRFSHLTEIGKHQVEMAKIPQCDLVFSSPLIRCIETTRILVGFEKLVYLCDGLLETQGPYPCNWREPLKSIQAKYRNVDTTLLAPNYSIINEHETPQHLYERATQSLEYILKLSKSKKAKSILIVTHNDWLKSLFGYDFKNAEVKTIELS